MKKQFIVFFYQAFEPNGDLKYTIAEGIDKDDAFSVAAEMENVIFIEKILSLEEIGNAYMLLPDVNKLLLAVNKALNEHFGVTQEEEGGNRLHDQVREMIAKMAECELTRNSQSTVNLKSPAQKLKERRANFLSDCVTAIQDYFRHSQRGLYELNEGVELSQDNLITGIEFEPNGDFLLVAEDGRYNLNQLGAEVLISLLSELEQSRPVASPLV